MICHDLPQDFGETATFIAETILPETETLPGETAPTIIDKGCMTEENTAGIIADIFADQNKATVEQRQEPASSSSSSNPRLVENLGRQVMKLEAEKSALALRLTQVHLKAEAEKSALAAQLSGLSQAAQKSLGQMQAMAHQSVAFVEHAAQGAVAHERALRIQAEQKIPPADPMVAKGGKKFAQPKSLAEWRERERRDRKNAKNDRRRKRKRKPKMGRPCARKKRAGPLPTCWRGDGSQLAGLRFRSACWPVLWPVCWLLVVSFFLRLPTGESKVYVEKFNIRYLNTGDRSN